MLLGNRAAGKSSAGNIILGKEAFALKRSAECVKREGEVSGRHVTIIEAPGWWKNICARHSPELNKREIVRSASMCPPGPHAFLLIVRVDTVFTQTHKNVAKQHLELLGDRIWSHIIVLFSCGDWLGDVPIEEHIEADGMSLQWMIEKCGHRYHVFNNQNRGNNAQVTELLGKIDDMVEGHDKGYYEMDMEILRMAEENNIKVAKMEQRRKTAQPEISVRSKRGKSLLGLAKSCKSHLNTIFINIFR